MPFNSPRRPDNIRSDIRRNNMFCYPAHLYLTNSQGLCVMASEHHTHRPQTGCRNSCNTRFLLWLYLGSKFYSQLISDMSSIKAIDALLTGSRSGRFRFTSDR